MTVLPQFLIHGLLFSMCLAGILRLSKELRSKRGALSSTLNLHDLTIISVVGAMHAGTVFFAPLWLVSIFSTLICIYGLLVFCDAMLFVQYRIEVNRQTLAWFFTGSRGLKKGVPHLLSVLRKYPVGALIPFFLIFLVAYSSLFYDIRTFAWITAFFLLVVLFQVKERSLDIYIAYSLVVFGAAILNAPLEYELSLAVIATSSLIILALICVLNIFKRWNSTGYAFLSTPSLLPNILANDDFTADDGVSLSFVHKTFVEPPSEIPKASELFGKCKGANVILITLESLGAYISPYTEECAHSRLAERLKKGSWISNQHFCLCPNTTVSTNQMYTGAYSNNPYNKEDSLYPGTDPKHIKHLRSKGYKTFFLDSADIALYDYHKLLKRIGFDKVWGTQDIPAHGLHADYRLWNMVDVIAEEAGESPFYLHIINDQTHMPYEVVDQARFNRHQGGTSKDTYLNAVEEVDFILDEFLARLSDRIDMQNTILVFTGDHGESFGEYGYSFHSNSVIMPQVQVPFMLNHPALGHRELSHSCHFDLFPTFFDLLGIECNYPTLGSSLVNDDRPYAYFFHSATLKGNTPANFGFLLDGEMYWMDRLFNQLNHLTTDAKGSKIRVLKGQERVYAETLLHGMLSTRNIIS